jgi:CRP/FNR family transcriptional regulator
MGLFDEVAFGRLDRRLAEFLHGAFGASGAAGGVLQMTHDQIASELGSAREVISRLLKDLERQGVVTLGRGRLELKDAQALESLIRSR